MSNLMLDVGQADELKKAFRRNGSCDRVWTNEKIKILSEGNILARVLDVIDGRAEIREIQYLAEISDTIIRVNHSISLVYPDWMEEVLHKDLELFGPSEYEIGLVEEWYHPQQKNGVVNGEVIHKYIIDNDILKDQLGLADLLAIQAKGIAFFRKYYAGKVVFGWRSVVRHDVVLLHVPCLFENGKEVIVRWDWFGLGWKSKYPALRFASK